MSAVFIKATHHEPGSDDLTGLNFTVEYNRGTALVSIPGMQPVPFQDRTAAFQAVLEDLAAALLEAVETPQGITENPQLPG